jgi:hypothetical protein
VSVSPPPLFPALLSRSVPIWCGAARVRGAAAGELLPLPGRFAPCDRGSCGVTPVRVAGRRN